MANVSAEFDKLLDVDMWVDVVVLFVGFFVPGLLEVLFEGATSMDIPDEIYGLLFILLVHAVMDGRQSETKMLTLGSGFYVADNLVERTDLKQTVENIVSNAGGA